MKPQKKLEIPQIIFGRDTDEAYKRIMAAPDTKEEPQPRQGTQGAFSLESLADCWRIHNVPYRNNNEIIDLQKTLLDNGASKTQDQWSIYSQETIQRGDFHLGDFPLYHAFFTTLFKNKDHPQEKDKIKEVREFLNDAFVKHWLMTLTRITYQPTGNDRVTHNIGLPDQYTIDETIIGPDERVKNASNQRPYKAILGTDDLQEIQSVYHWITDKDAYFYRVNQPPPRGTDRVAGFCAYSGWAFLDCYGDPQGSLSGLGVRRARSAAKNRGIQP